MGAAEESPVRVRTYASLSTLLKQRANLREVLASVKRTGQVLNSDFQLVVVAPVIIDNTIRRIDGPIEPFFDIVEPNRGSTNKSGSSLISL